MEQHARSGERELRPIGAIAWRAPPGWVRPDWLPEEVDSPSESMTPRRMAWCMQALGWSIAELAMRLDSGQGRLYRMLEGHRAILRALAYWLEERVAANLPLTTAPYTARADLDRLPPVSDIAWHPSPGAPLPHWFKAPPEPSIPMTPERLRWCCDVVGWSSQELARRTGHHDGSIRQMKRGKRTAPPGLAYWLEPIVAVNLALPPLPSGWRAADCGEAVREAD